MQGIGQSTRNPYCSAIACASLIPAIFATAYDSFVGSSGPVKDRRVSRERSLNRLLAGLRAVNAGDFSVQLVADGDPLVADVIEVFNSVVQKQSRLVDEISRVSGSVGREAVSPQG